MSKKYYWLVGVAALAFLAVVGLGLWKTYKNPSQGKSSQTNAANGQEQPWLYPDEEPGPDSEQARRSALDKAIKKYRQASTFRAKVWRPYGKDKLSGSLEYVRPLRLHATLEITNQPSKTELIIVGETAYAKSQDGQWKIVNDADIKTFARNFFTEMLVPDQTLASFGVPENSPLTFAKKNDKNCVEAKTKYKSGDALYDISFCVNDKNDLVYVWMQAADGDVLTEYSDFNSLITIERPSLPLLDRRFQITE